MAVEIRIPRPITEIAACTSRGAGGSGLFVAFGNCARSFTYACNKLHDGPMERLELLAIS